MNPGVACWGDMPRLNMLLTIAGETLTGEARPVPSPEIPGPRRLPSSGYAKAWLGACARAQRLLEANGSSELFSDQPLRVAIGSPAAPGPWAAAAEDALGSATNAAFKGARWLAGALASAARDGAPGMDAAASAADKIASALGSRMPSPTVSMVADPASPSGARAPLARLPTSGRVLHQADGLGRSTPFWTPQELAQYIAVHEFGHCAQAIHATNAGAYYGWSLMDAERQGIFANLGALDAPCAREPIADALRTQFGECYADVFAALALGGRSPDSVLAWASDIASMRAANIPSDLERYSSGDSEHDTREALAELRALLDGADAPGTGRSVHEMCMRCAQAGCLRWTAAIASQNAGDMSTLFWIKSARLAADSESKAFFEDSFDELALLAGKSPLLAPIASSLALAPAGARAGHAAGILILLDIERLAGAPRLDLAGSEPTQLAASSGLWSKLSRSRQKRSESARDKPKLGS